MNNGDNFTIAATARQITPPRRLTVTKTDSDSTITKITITVKGYDQDGNYVEESWYLKDIITSGTAYQGKIYFKRIDLVTLALFDGGGSGDAISVGTGNAYDNFVFLSNKPIRPETEVVTNAAGTTTYTRDTDYRMDYINGAIKFINGGSMAAATAYLIDYTKSKLGINISSIIPVVTRIQRVEYPVDFIPQQFVSFNITGDFLYIASKRAGQSQEELTNGEHIAIYYERKHMAPGDGSPGSYPDFMDEVITIGAAGYALLTEAMQHELAAATAITSLGSALTNVVKYLNNNSAADLAGILQDITDDAADLRSAIVTALNAANGYLDDVDTTDLGKATVGAEAYTESGDNFINLVNVGDRVAEIYADYARARVDIANARVNSAVGYVQEANSRLSNLQTYINQAEGYNQLAQGFIQEAQLRAEAVNGNLVLSDRYRTEGLNRLNEFHAILRTRSEYAKRMSSVPVRQPA